MYEGAIRYEIEDGKICVCDEKPPKGYLFCENHLLLAMLVCFLIGIVVGLLF